MLWIALHLPLLSLESWAATLISATGERALALIDLQRIVSVNTAARALGVEPASSAPLHWRSRRSSRSARPTRRVTRSRWRRWRMSR